MLPRRRGVVISAASGTVVRGLPRGSAYVASKAAIIGLTKSVALELRGTGVLEGSIAERPSGSEGFGFDPVFVPQGETRTVAELGNAWKTEHSHRARAAQALRRALAPPRSPHGGPARPTS